MSELYRLNIYDELLNTLNGGADDDGGETLVKNLAQEELRIIDEAVMLAGRNFLTACNMLQIHEHVTGRNGKIGDGLDIDADEVASSMQGFMAQCFKSIGPSSSKYAVHAREKILDVNWHGFLRAPTRTSLTLSRTVRVQT